MSARCHHPDCGLPTGECASRDCLLISLNRVDATTLTKGQVVSVAGEIEQRKPDVHTEELGGIRFAFSVYRLYRSANHSRIASVRQAWRAVRGPK